MRKILLIMATIFSLTAVGQANMTVYLSNGEVKVYDKADVDSVTFGMSGDTDKYNGYEYVDLGLPSGLKWATCNIGADAPEKYGDFYEWAETEPRDRYGKGNKYSSDGSSLKYSKYNKDDNKTLLDPEDDVAHMKMRGAWRMPTLDELKELFNQCQCSVETAGDVKGFRITGPNGNSMFMPLAGYNMGESISKRGYKGIYWSSSLYEDEISSKANTVSLFDTGKFRFESLNRSFGCCVRAVIE